MSDVKLITKILNDIRRHLDDVDNSKLLQECEYLGLCVGKCFMSAMTVYRLRKISRLSKNYLNENVQSLKVEIADLIETLTRLVYWRCGTCGKIVDAENENNLELWIHAHKIICKRKENTDKLIA